MLKDKLFFFGAYEGQRYTVGNSAQLNLPLTVPNPGSPDVANSIPDAIADLQAHGVTPSAVSLKVAGCVLGPPVTCDGKGFPTNAGANGTQVTVGFPNTVSADNAVGKVDFHLNEHNMLNGTYFFGNGSGTVDDALQLQPRWLTLIHTRAASAGSRTGHTSPTPTGLTNFALDTIGCTNLHSLRTTASLLQVWA